MSSRVFQAKAGHTTERPQICGLTKKTISKGDWILYLVCHGNDARPEYQIKVVSEREVEKEVYDRRKRRKVLKTVTERDYGMGGRQFKTVYGGKKINPQTGKKEKSFLWQEKIGIDADGEPMWRTVKCWSHIVFAEAAERLGYEVRADANGAWVKTVALDGDRAVGSEHTVEVEEDNAMVTLARAALSEIEAGIVTPNVEVDEVQQLIDEIYEEEAESYRMQAEIACNSEADDRRDAESLGMTLRQYRQVLAANR